MKKKLVVGLGNPGAQYAMTRHNIGFHLLDRRVVHQDRSRKQHAQPLMLLAQGELEQVRVICVQPHTYMNRSGSVVRFVCDYNDIAPDDILVLHDDIDLETARLQCKQGGGAAGHNGLKDIIAQLDSRNFWRIRVGVGRPSHPSFPISDYVLGRFGDAELTSIMEKEQIIATRIEDWIAGRLV